MYRPSKLVTFRLIPTIIALSIVGSDAMHAHYAKKLQGQRQL